MIQCGSAKLYKMDIAKTVAQLGKEAPANYQPFTEKFTADRHSFSVVELTSTSFELRQIGIGGEEIDRFRITKGAR